MPTIQNVALHAFDFPRKGKNERIGFPAAVAFAPGKVRPSETVIDSNALAELKEHDIGGVWFGPAGLVVKPESVAETAPETTEAPVADQAAPVEGGVK